MTDELTELREQVAALAAEVTQLRTQLAGAPKEPELSSPMTRRVALGAIAAGVAGAVALKPTPAAASTGTMTYGTIMNAGPSATQLNSSNPATTFHGTCNGTPVQNNENAAAVSGFSVHGCGIKGIAKGVANENIERFLAGVVGQSDARAGVVGISASNVGVFGRSKTGTAVQALAVGIQATGMYGVSHGPSGGSAFGGVVGDSDTNAGVCGLTSANTRAAGEFVHTGNGRGATFKGGAAQARLIPNTTATHPASGFAGDLYVDNAKRLWFCKGGNTWVQVA